ncbi:GGDEF domain-containing protein [Streptomyces aureoverticillatus]|uniref:GGDEF domain-containing protein n=1 Tax=Streptomyces aureoverticillatus TaxID=66871 RepID=UPI0013DD230C|nr:GGDEF domain-containing protein [Streptomyces aureoverticillatus]QIB49517.1 GGDEF domain-containing protein [Streptomyces aureoverticillatus]
MASHPRAGARIGQRALFLTTATIPVAGWVVHAATLHRRLAAERQHLAEAARRLEAARRDELTGLHARPGYVQHATRHLQDHGDQTMLVFLDAVDFKAVNDTLGHDAGNALIIAIASRLEQWVGDTGLAARLHGDEFAAVLTCPVIDRDRRLEQLHHLHHLLHHPFDVDGQAVDVAVSIGMSSPSDLHSRDYTYVLRGAEGAMYEHKREGTGLYRIATPKHANEPTVNGRRLGRTGTTAHPLAPEDLR